MTEVIFYLVMIFFITMFAVLVGGVFIGLFGYGLYILWKICRDIVKAFSFKK